MPDNVPSNEKESLPPPSFERFGVGSRRILVEAEKRAKRLHIRLSSGLVLTSLLEAKGTLAADILESFDVNAQDVEQILAEQGVSRSRGMTPELRAGLECAFIEASHFHHFSVDPEHLLLGILSVDDSQAAAVLQQLSVPWQKIQGQLHELFVAYQSMEQEEELAPEFVVPGQVHHGQPEKQTAIEQFTTDLTAQASSGKLDPLIGREQELTRLLHILSRRTKNNPVLLGDPGVGKTAIVEGLAHRLISADQQYALSGYRLLQLDLGLLVAGTMYRGQFEERLKKLLSELKEAKKTIVFVDEMHSMVGAGGAEGAMDAAQMLKPALARGAIRLIGATTSAEYQKIISKDKALERRFQTIRVLPPSKEETLAILRGLKNNYAEFHHVKITDESLKAAVTMADRYVTDRFFPDKAIDVLDEAAAAIRTSRPAGLKSKMPVVGQEAIAKIITNWTGIPTENLLEAEQARLAALEVRLSERIIGQAEAVRAVSRTIRRYKSGVLDPRRPLGAFLLIGPTGVGKTELARAVAEEAFGHRDALVKIDLSEFMERHQTARLLGAPPGYVGYDQGSSLGEELRRRPHAVVLFDEIEKASYDFPNLLLQIMEDGQLTDSQGNVISFRHSLILMTSNLGMAEAMRPALELGFQDPDRPAVNQTERLEGIVQGNVRDYFAPEFLSRLSGVLVFNRLGQPEMKKIAELELKKLKLRLKNQRRSLSVDTKVVEQIAAAAEDSAEGARLIRRLVESEVEPVLADAIISDPGKRKLQLTTDGITFNVS